MTNEELEAINRIANDIKQAEGSIKVIDFLLGTDSIRKTPMEYFDDLDGRYSYSVPKEVWNKLLQSEKERINRELNSMKKLFEELKIQDTFQD